MPDTELIAEQLRHAMDLIRADLDAIRATQKHDREFLDQRLKALEELSRDHESRIRTATDGVTTFKTWSGLASGGSSILSIIAFLKSLLP